jgi:hypothetical protein
LAHPILSHPFLQGWTWLSRNDHHRALCFDLSHPLGLRNQAIQDRYPAVRSLYRQHYRGRPFAWIRFWYMANDRPKMSYFK